MTRKLQLLLTTLLLAVGVNGAWGQKVSVSGTVVSDTHVRTDNSGTSYGTYGVSELYNNVKSGSELEFVCLYNLKMPYIPSGSTINSVKLRLVSKRAKGPNDVKIYQYGNTVTNSATWDSESSYITSARSSETNLITSFTVAGQRGKDITDNGITSDYEAISAWTNTIDITDYAKTQGSLASFNLLLSAATTQQTGDADCFFMLDCSDSYTNNNNSKTYSKADLVPTLTVTYTVPNTDDMLGSGVSASSLKGITDDGISTDTEDGNSVLKFTPSAIDEVGIQFSFNNDDVYKINNSQNFYLVVTNKDAISTSGNFNCYNIYLDGTEEVNKYEGSTNKAIYTIGDYQVIIYSPMSKTSSALFSKFNNTADDADISVKKAQVYFTVASTNQVTIYRAGFYNLGKILSMYPELAAKNWQFVSAAGNNGLRIEAYGGANSGITGSDGTIRVKNDNTEKSTVSIFKQQMRSLGNLPPNYTSIYMYHYLMNDDAKAAKEDLLSSKSGVRFTFKPELVKYFPTLTPKKVVADQGFYWGYKDKCPAVKEDFFVFHGWSTQLVDYTRLFQEGCNSCIVPFKVDVSELPDGLTAYTLTSVTDGVVSFTKVASDGPDIEPNTPMIIQATSEGVYIIPSTNDADPVSPLENYYESEAGTAKFVGSYTDEKVSESDYASRSNYGIDKNGKLAKMGASTKTTYYRAFLSLPAGATARIATFVDEDETTGIRDMKCLANGNVMNNEVYDLSGRRIAQPTKGLYIVNGKKVVIK